MFRIFAFATYEVSYIATENPRYLAKLVVFI